ncbi:MAG: hypothetical protein AAF488_01430 [Planctomycetota bacterium]
MFRFATASLRYATLLALIVTGAIADAQNATPKPTSQPASKPKPAAETEVDAKAAELADAVLERIGGRKGWEATAAFRWTFFSGGRTHYWDRENHRARVEWDDAKSSKRIVALLDLGRGSGRVWEADSEPTDTKRRDALLEQARKAWINDSYWLLMPFKLRDPGVNLKYAGPGKMADQRDAELLELTFVEGAGVTPKNKYRVYVAQDTGLIEQWDFFLNATDNSPRLSTSWGEWKQYGKIWLSTQRSAYRLKDVAVFEKALPESVFTDPKPVILKPNSAGSGKKSG